MYSDSKEIRRVSPNLSLRRSPERKNPQRRYSQKNIPSSLNNISSYKTRTILRCCNCCCCPCRCYHFCYCCNCCYCCNPCCHLNYRNNIRSSNKINDPILNKYDNINSSTAIGSTKYQTNENPKFKSQNTYFSYEQNQFNDFLRKLIEVESKLEDFKIDLAQNPDFICDDIFSLFEQNNKGYLDEEDLKNGLNLIGLNVSDQDIRLLMKRFDLQKTGHISYADFFDIIVPFEKNYRQIVERRNPTSDSPNPDNFSPNTMNGLGELFNLILAAENEINNMRKLFGTLRLNLRDIFSLIDKRNLGSFTTDELIEYLENNRMMNNNRDADLLFIRLDKNRNGKIDFSEIEDEIQTLY